MIAVSILLVIWTAALSYTTSKYEKRRKAELEQSYGNSDRKGSTDYA